MQEVRVRGDKVNSHALVCVVRDHTAAEIAGGRVGDTAGCPDDRAEQSGVARSADGEDLSETPGEVLRLDDSPGRITDSSPHGKRYVLRSGDTSGRRAARSGTNV